MLRSVYGSFFAVNSFLMLLQIEHSSLLYTMMSLITHSCLLMFVARSSGPVVRQVILKITSQSTAMDRAKLGRGTWGKDGYQPHQDSLTA